MNSGSVEEWSPKDGGLKAWLTILASFFVTIVFGIINNYGIIYVELLKNLEEKKYDDAAYKASLVGSLCVGSMFLFSPVTGVLVDALGFKTTSLIGGAIGSSGLLISSWIIDWVEALYFTYGIMFGVGASMIYTPALAIIGLHFKKRLGVVFGAVSAGESMWTVALPPLLGAVTAWAGLQGVLRVLSGCMLVLMAMVAMLYSVPEEALRLKEKVKCCPPKLNKLVNVEIWKKKRYVLWVSAVFIAVFGYFVPFVHINQLVTIQFPERDGAQMVMFIGITSGIARLVFGKIADFPQVNRIVLQQVAFVSLGTLTMLITTASEWWHLVTITLLMGVFDGCFLCVLGPIAFDLCGQENGAQAIGFLFGLLSVPLTVGPPVAGYIYDRTSSYFLPFLLAGCPSILGGLALTAVHFVASDPPERWTKREAAEDAGDEPSSHQLETLLDKPSSV